MEFIVDHDLHIHSKLSLCSSDPEQNNERILQYAKENNLKTICLTDHFWDYPNVECEQDWYRKQNFEHISKAKPLPQADGIKFLFGCETEMNREMEIGLTKERFDDFDFVIIPTTHFHMDFVMPAEISTPEQRAQYWLKRLNILLDMDLPFYKIGIAHLTCGLIDKTRKRFLDTINSLGTTDLKNVFEKAAKKGVGIELNGDDMKFTDEEAATVLRPYKIAKDVGCKFYCGSDSHHPKDFVNIKSIFERAIKLLELTEDDKWHIG